MTSTGVSLAFSSEATITDTATEMRNGSHTVGDYRILGDAQQIKITEEVKGGDFQSMVLRYYHKSVDDIRKKFKVPTRCRNFRGITSHFQRWLDDRIPANSKFLDQQKKNLDAQISIITHCYKAEHPQISEVDEWMKRWDDDGDWDIKARKIRKALYLPFVLFEHGNKHSTIMMAVVMVVVPE